MRQRSWLAAIVGFTIVVSWGLAAAGIVGSKHDFAAAGWNSSSEICIACHTPHSKGASNSTPLWNHTETTTTYTLYASPTLLGTIEQPRPASKLCLSCHDGTIALNSFGGATGATFIQGDANIGTDLSGSHPISVTWVHRDVTDCLNCHSIQFVGGVAVTLFSSPLPFFDGRVECPTCHDPHNVTPDNPSAQYMLRLTQSKSSLCLHCHHK